MDDLFQLQSMAKPIASAAALQRMARGLMRPSDPVPVVFALCVQLDFTPVQLELPRGFHATTLQAHLPSPSDTRPPKAGPTSPPSLPGHPHKPGPGIPEALRQNGEDPAELPGAHARTRAGA